MKDFHFIFYFALLVTRCAYWLFGITEDDLFVPIQSKGQAALCVLVDISGSMGGRELANCAISVVMLLGKLAPQEIAIALFESDTHVIKGFQQEREIDEVTDRLLELAATGGTRVDAALKWANEQFEEVPEAEFRLLFLLSDYEFFESPKDLLRSLVLVLGGDETAPTLAEALGRPLWLDFVADTGDDRDVSLGVGRILAPPYLIDENGTERELPRGEVLLFGGDTAYPVATADEIQRRLVGPWNEALREAMHPGVEVPNSKSHRRVDGKRRVLIGIPGNHDWYDGLDGFGRLFRKNPQKERMEEPTPSAEGPPIFRKLRKLPEKSATILSYGNVFMLWS